MFCIKGSGMAEQGPKLQVVPVLPCLYKDHGGCPFPVMGSGHQEPQLLQRLAHHGPVTRLVVRSQGPGAPAPQPVWAWGSNGK